MCFLTCPLAYFSCNISFNQNEFETFKPFSFYVNILTFLYNILNDNNYENDYWLVYCGLIINHQADVFAIGIDAMV